MDEATLAAIAVAVAGAAAGKAAEAVIQGGKTAVRSLARLVKERFAGEPSANAALEAAAESPDEANTARLARAIGFVVDVDEAFADDLRRAWEAAKVEISQTGDGSVAMNFSGVVKDGGTAVQAGHIDTLNIGRHP